MKKHFFLFLIFAFIASFVYAQQALQPVLYGQAFNGNSSADGSSISVYPQKNQSDNLTDVVGVGGNFNLSSYWKINLNSLHTELSDGDIIVIHITDGQNESTRYYTVNSAEGIENLSLNYNPSYQDYDDDNEVASTDCNDNNAVINHGAAEICGDGIDQDCTGTDLSCPATTSGGGGGGGGSGGGGCSYNWECSTWSDCSQDGKQTRTCTNKGTCTGTAGEPAEVQNCVYNPPATGQTELQPVTTTEVSETSNQSEKLAEQETAEETPAETETSTTPAPTGFAALTGNVISQLGKPNIIGAIIVFIIIIAGAYTGYYYLYKKK